jgi:hypothetical protein
MNFSSLWHGVFPAPIALPDIAPALCCCMGCFLTKQHPVIDLAIVLAKIAHNLPEPSMQAVLDVLTADGSLERDEEGKYMLAIKQITPKPKEVPHG